MSKLYLADQSFKLEVNSDGRKEVNYKVFLAHSKDDDGNFTLIDTVFLEEWQRLQIGQEIRLRVAKGLWKVVRVIPPNNPTGQSNSYFVEKIRSR